MCGISGIINLESNISDEKLATTKKMVSLIKHRGPDSLGFYNDKNVSVANARLAIMDPRKIADLPILSDKEDVVICFNGEVTNFIELKEKYQLDSKYYFNTQSDSEVLLYLYLEFGIDFLNKLTGMFSLCIYDKRIDQVYLVRDFFGIIPLFYLVDGNNIYFASEIKALLEVPTYKKTVNKQAVYDYFTLAYVPGEQTMFEGIKEVRNGQLITIKLNDKSLSKKYYYRMKYNVDSKINFEDARLKVKELFYSSVERNLRSDVPVGVTLSGGVDTSGIVSVAHDLGLSKNLHTFSIKMGEGSFDESHFQRLVSKKCETIHHEYLVTPSDVIDNFYGHLAHVDEPIGDGSTIPFFILANKAKKHVKVLLNGEGGDEVFNAYSIYQAWKVRKYYNKFVPSFIKKISYNVAHILKSDYSKLSFDFMSKRFTEGAELHPAAAHIYWRHPLTNKEKDRIFKHEKFRSTDELMVKLWDEYSHTEELNRVSMLDFEYFITDDLMLKNDRMVIAHSLEGRFPFLDRELVDYVQTLPTHFKLKGLKGRYIQKMALKDVLPKEILKRSNYGLEMPHSLWFFTGFKDFIEKYINEERIKKFDFLDWDEISKIYKDHISKKRDYGRGLWCIINFLAWHEMFIETDNYKKHLVR